MNDSSLASNIYIRGLETSGVAKITQKSVFCKVMYNFAKLAYQRVKVGNTVFTLT